MTRPCCSSRRAARPCDQCVQTAQPPYLRCAPRVSISCSAAAQPFSASRWCARVHLGVMVEQGLQRFRVPAFCCTMVRPPPSAICCIHHGTSIKEQLQGCCGAFTCSITHGVPADLWCTHTMPDLHSQLPFIHDHRHTLVPFCGISRLYGHTYDTAVDNSMTRYPLSPQRD